MSERNLDKLALVSKILIDQRMLALRRENERHRFRTFWLKHSSIKLKELMQIANREAVNGPRCACVHCQRMDRQVVTFEPQFTTTCLFTPWFNALVASCGLVCETLVDDYDLDPDAHFVLLGPRSEWINWQYGKKLVKKPSLNDPELQKLKQLFDRMGEIRRATNEYYMSEEEYLLPVDRTQLLSSVGWKRTRIGE
jgi:hypothetical protein